MPWRACSVMEERLRFVARLLDGEGDEAAWATPQSRSCCPAPAVSDRHRHRSCGQWREHRARAARRDRDGSGGVTAVARAGP